MSQTITTKYLNPTASTGARIKATTSSGGDSVTVAYDYNDEKQGHVNAAQKLKDKLGWKGQMIGGHTKDGYVFVFDDEPQLRVNPVPPLKSKRRKKSSTGVSLNAALNMLKNKGVITTSQKDINEAVKRLSKLPQPTAGYYYADDVDDLAAEMVQDLVNWSETKKNPIMKPIKRNKTNYKGKYPDNIALIYSGKERGTLYVQTNIGDLYLINAKDVGNISPKLRTNFHDYINQNCNGCGKKQPKVKANPRRSSQHHAAFKAKAEVMGLKGQYVVMKSDDGKNYIRIATFVLKANAIDYAKAYAKAAPKSYIKVERI